MAERVLRLILDRLRNVGVIGGEGQLHRHIAIPQLDPFHDPKRNDVATEAGIFHRLERFPNMFLGDRHGTGKLRSRRAE
jgi:hypothetical protein